MPNPDFHEIVSEIHRFAETANDFTALQEFSVDVIGARVPYHNWMGFYLLHPGDDKVLVLGPFRGAPTEHVRIPVTEGICGAAVAQGETVIVEDVSADPWYLACSLDTRSKIVIPIRANGKIAGEIDIDSQALNAIGADDRSFLQRYAEVPGQFLEE